MPKVKDNNPEMLTAKKQAPHLALRGVGEQWLRIPVGSYMAYVEDASQPDGVFAWHLKGVTRRSWEFECPCGRQGCTRKMSAKMKYTGRHDGPSVVR